MPDGAHSYYEVILLLDFAVCTVQMLAFTCFRRHLGLDHQWTLNRLKAWVAVDPTSGEALGHLVQSSRRQLLRSFVSMGYRLKDQEKSSHLTSHFLHTQCDPGKPIKVGRRTLVRALVECLAMRAPKSNSVFEPQTLKYFRWLADYLGPVEGKLDVM